ncbi:MAG TPA: PfkB family carbohydrate kinase [Phycisphaerales bacterium]|nr:PfkB family carbohydrate kinase [Phycisphaerales bacterium]
MAARPSSSSLIVTGTVGIDTIEAPTGRAESVLGGSCTYFSAAASFYGPVRMVAAVGDDFPPTHLSTLAGFKGIDKSGLEIRRGSKTFRWTGKYRDNMDQRDSLETQLNILLEAPPPVPERFRDSQYVFLANMHPGLQASMLAQFPKRKLAVADTMDLWINNARKDLEKLLTLVDGLVLNYDEAELLTGKRNPVAAARHILTKGPRFVVVKKGEHGALLIHRDGLGALPAYPAEIVVDPTGAGDTFAGGMMGAIASGAAGGTPGSFGQLLRAIAHGTVVASFNIEAFSLDRLKTLKWSQLRQRHGEYLKMIHAHGAPKARPAAKPAKRAAEKSTKRR